MKIAFRNPSTWFAGALLAAVCVSAGAAVSSPFVGSRSEPHAVLYLNYKMVPRKIYPVRIWMPDAKQMHDLKLKLEAGKAYYIGAQFDNSGAWQPVVWKTADVK